MDHRNHEPTPSFWKSPAGLAWLVAMAVGGYYLLTEHQAHLYGALPYLVLAACPVMHLFMQRGHHHGGHHEAQHPDDARGGSHDRRDH